MRKYFLPLLVNERGIEPIVLRKANPFVSFKFEDVKLLCILNFFSGAKRLNFSLKAYKTSETKSYFPHQWFEDPEKLNNTQLPHCDTIFSKLCKINSRKRDYSDFQGLKDDDSTSEETLLKLKLKQLPDFLRW